MDFNTVSDYNLLWDSSRKILDVVNWFLKKYPTIEGWRKSQDWFSSLKSLSRAVGQASASGGKGKADRILKVARQYVTKATALKNKINNSKDSFPIVDIMDLVQIL